MSTPWKFPPTCPQANPTRKLFVADEISTFKSENISQKKNTTFISKFCKLINLQSSQKQGNHKGKNLIQYFRPFTPFDRELDFYQWVARKSQKKEPVYSVLDQLPHLVEHKIFNSVSQV